MYAGRTFCKSLSFISAMMCHFITRSEWKANPPKHITELSLPVPYVVIHHTYIPKACNTTNECISAMQAMQKFHQVERKWDDIGYNFAIGGDGNVYEGRGWARVGAHALHFNNVSIGISMIGDYTLTNPSDIMQIRAKELINYGVVNNYIQTDYKLIGHRQVSNTECPGSAFFETVQTWPHWSPEV